MLISAKFLRKVIKEELELENNLVLKENLLKDLYNKLVTLFNKPEQLDASDIIEYVPEVSSFPETRQAYEKYDYLINVKKMPKEKAFRKSILPIIYDIRQEIKAANKRRRRELRKAEKAKK